MKSTESYPPHVTLGDVGERDIVSKILAPRYRDGNPTFGDDVADFGILNGGVLVATTDPAPTPVAWDYFPSDFYDWGWLLGALNLSDLAAAGADPLGLLTSFTLPSRTELHDFLRLLDGVDAICHQFGTQVRGGNIKESPNAVCDATALGISASQPLSRAGAEPGDCLYAFGEVGMFWAALLALSEDQDALTSADRQLRKALTRPRPQIGVGRDLRSSGLAKSCTDASDGLYAAIKGLTSDQGLGCTVLAGTLRLCPAAEAIHRGSRIDPIRLALGFGNLELVCSASSENESLLSQIAKRNNAHMTKVAQVNEDLGVRIEIQGRVGALENFDNERFSGESQFTGGLPAYRHRLITRPLFRD